MTEKDVEMMAQNTSIKDNDTYEAYKSTNKEKDIIDGELEFYRGRYVTKDEKEFFDVLCDEGSPKIQDVRDIFNQYYEISEEDQVVIDVFLAALCDRRVGGDPLWLYIVGPSGYLKTALCRSSKKLDDVYFLDTMTDKTLVSGLTRKDKDTKKDMPRAGILMHLDGRVLVIKDLTALLSLRDYKRDGVFAQLRNAFDGYYDAGFGSLPEPIRLKSSFGFIGAATPIIDNYTKAMVTMGPRCLTIRTWNPPMEEAANKAQNNTGNENEMREELQNIVRNFIEGANFGREIHINEEMRGKISALANYTAHMRTHVMADYRNGDIMDYSIPAIEVPTRLAKQLRKMGAILAILREHETMTDEDYSTLLRVAKDTAIPEYQFIMEYYLEDGDLDAEYNPNEISDMTGLHYRTARRKIELMEAIGILKRRGNKYGISDYFKGIIERAGLTVENYQ